MGLGGSTHPGSAVPCLGMAQVQHKAVRVCKKTSQALLMPRETIITIFLSDSSLGSGHPTRHRLWINTAGLLDFWIKKYKVAHKERVGLQKSVCSRNSKHISHRNNGDKAERGRWPPPFFLLPPPKSTLKGFGLTFAKQYYIMTKLFLR